MALTRKDIRRQIGYDLAGTQPGALRISTMEAGSTREKIADARLNVTLADASVLWIVANGDIRRIADVEDEGTSPPKIVLDRPLSADPRPGDEYEVWDQQYPPPTLHSILRQAILTAQEYGVWRRKLEREWYVEPGGKRVAVPPGFNVINRVEREWAGLDVHRIDLWTQLQGIAEDEDTRIFGFPTMLIAAGEHTFTRPTGYSLGLMDRFGLEFHAAGAGYLAPAQASPESERVAFTEGWSYRSLPHPPALGSYSFYVSAPISVVRASFLHESAIRWDDMAGWFLWPGSGMIELNRPSGWEYGLYRVGTRLRVHGGEALPLPSAGDGAAADAYVLPDEVPTNYLRTTALVSLLRQVGRGQNEAVVSREWERQAQMELASLTKLHNAHPV